MHLNPRLATALLLAADLLAVPAGGSLSSQPAPGAAPAAAADDGAAWFPDSTSFAPLRAAPREVALRGAFVVADREDGPDDFPGANVEADVAVGHRLGVVRLRRETDDGPELTLGFEVGVFSRFFMESAQKDLIGVGYRVGAPLSARYRGWAARFTVRHVSSHLGDDFVNRFDPPPGQTTRDGMELLAARRLASGLRVYVGGEWNFHRNTGVERTAARAGVEWNPAPGRRDARPGGSGEVEAGPAVWPFAAVDVRTTSLDGDVAASGAGGIALRVAGTTLRAEVRGHAGSTPVGGLRNRDESHLGLGLRVEP